MTYYQSKQIYKNNFQANNKLRFFIQKKRYKRKKIILQKMWFTSCRLLSKYKKKKYKCKNKIFK